MVMLSSHGDAHAPVRLFANMDLIYILLALPQDNLLGCQVLLN